MQNFNEEENPTLYNYYELGAWTSQLILQNVMKKSPNYEHFSFDESMYFFIKRLNDKFKFLNIPFFIYEKDDISLVLFDKIISSFNEPQKYEKKYAYTLGENVLFWLMNNVIIDDNINNTNNFVNQIYISLKAINITDEEIFKCFDIENYKGNTKEEFNNYIQNNFNYFNGLIEMILKRIPVYNGIQKEEKNCKYDVALSFAGEDREYVEKIANDLREKGIKVFYDKFEVANLFGKDLYQYLSYIYKDAARYCMIFISKYYKEKAWTGHELKNAQNRAFKENQEYILPVYLEDIQIDGLLDTVGYLKTSEYSSSEIVDITITKLNEL